MEGVIVSFIISVCGVNFSLTLGDGRMTNLSTGEVAYEKIQKIYKINNNVCIGFTGDPIAAGIALKELDSYSLNTMTLERIKRVFIGKLKEIPLNPLGIKVIITGRNKSNKFVTYSIDSKNNFEEESYVNIPDAGFVVVYSGSNSSVIELIVNKNIYSTSPWKSIDDLRQHMTHCIREVALIDPTVNNEIYEVMIQ